MKKRGREEGKHRQRKSIKGGRRKETNSESGARRRIFGDGPRSMGSARVGYPMHLQTVRSTSQDLVNDEGNFPFGLEFVLFLVR